jgi:hypothetical protein
MNYTADMLEIWWATLSHTMKDQTMRFPIALVLGALLAGVFWLLAAYSARLWNRRFYLNMGLQLLCGLAAILTLLYTLTFASSDSLVSAIDNTLLKWETTAKNDGEWKHEAFCRAWDEVAAAGTEPDVTKSPSPRTDPSINLLSMNNPQSKIIVARSHANSANEQFRAQNPYLSSILKPPGSVPDAMLEADLIEWFTSNPGTSYPLERGVNVLVTILKNQAKSQMSEVITYTKRLSLGLFLVTQLVVFILISFLAYRSISPTR